MASRSRDHGIAVERKLKLVPHEHDDPMLTKNSSPTKTWIWIGATLVLAYLVSCHTLILPSFLSWLKSLI